MSVKPPSGIVDQRYAGVTEGLVVDVDDPDGLGRVKVKLPWFDSQEVSDWCRVAQTYAGNGYGAFWLPEEGDEVLVGFLFGDPRVPMVLASVYNGVDKPKRPRSSTVDEKAFRTKGGHHLLFDDSSGDKGVEIATAAGHRLTFADDGRRIELAAKGGPSITMDLASGAMTIAATTVTIKASGVLDMQGSPIKLNSDA
jgi:uncharacterized protein involved in type VI secretion and phage assembly